MSDAYYSVVRNVLENGYPSDDRTKTGTLKLFGAQMRFDLSKGTIPLITAKHVSFKNVLTELLWFISGSTNVKDLQGHGNPIWDDWAAANGDLGPIYGHQWRMWNGEIDQLAKVIEILRVDPNSRRAIVSAWNPSDLSDMALEPCHMMFQFWTRKLSFIERCGLYDDSRMIEAHCIAKRFDDGEYYEICAKINDEMDRANIPKYQLSCGFYMRSNDLFLGAPYNIASYSILTRMVAKLLNMSVGEVVWTGGDCHIYSNHVDQVREMLSRANGELPELPTLVINGNQSSIDDFKIDDFSIEGYKPFSAIRAPVAV